MSGRGWCVVLPTKIACTPVPGMLKAITLGLSGSGLALEFRMAWRSEPVPASLTLVTTKVVEGSERSSRDSSSGLHATSLRGDVRHCEGEDLIRRRNDMTLSPGKSEDRSSSAVKEDWTVSWIVGDYPSSKVQAGLDSASKKENFFEMQMTLPFSLLNGGFCRL